MADSNFTTHRQTLEIDQVKAVDVTEIVDAQDGSKVRELRVFGSPDGTDAPPVLTVRVKADTADPLEVQTPKLNF